MSLTWITIILFAIGALIGLTMALAAFKGQFPKVSSAVLHFVFAGTALVLLLVSVVIYKAAGPSLWALCLFVLAALGGLMLAFGFHAKKKALPPAFVAVHALVAVIGFLILLAGALKLV